MTMILAVIGPEMIALWTMRQRIAAGRIWNEYNEVYIGMSQKCQCIHQASASAY